jgi:hypothetical protein
VNETIRHRTDGTTRETASYIASLAGELAQMANAGKMPLLSYLLEMARLEANSIAHADVGKENTPTSET